MGGVHDYLVALTLIKDLNRAGSLFSGLDDSCATEVLYSYVCEVPSIDYSLFRIALVSRWEF